MKTKRLKNWKKQVEIYEQHIKLLNTKLEKLKEDYDLEGKNK
jgi:ppGpp synthetase/RelA/SpoT-type nucleotidyltranferase